MQNLLIPTQKSAHRSDRRPATSKSFATDLIAVASAVVGVAAASDTMFDHRLPSSPDDVVVYLATLGAALLGSWWVANVAGWVIAMRKGLSLERFTLPGTKRVAQLLLALTLTTTACSTGATDEPTMHLLASAPATTTETAVPPTTAAPTTAVPPTTAAPPTTTPTTATTDPFGDEIWNQPARPTSAVDEGSASPARSEIAEHRVVVIAGDNLWSIAEATLVHHGIDEPSTAQVAAYWRAVLAANRVRSGNPNLIMPGESITMPTHTPASAGP